MIALLSALALAADPALPPTSRWTLAPKGQCTISRDYDTANMPLTIGLRSYPLGKYANLIVVVPRSAFLGGTARPLEMEIGKLDPIRASRGFVSADGRSFVLSFPIRREQLSTLEAAETLSATLGGSTTVSVRLTGMTKALAQLALCDATALRALGIDPDEQAGMATAAVATRPPASLISPDDYPSEAMRDKSQGFSYIVWTIGLDGRVSDCQVPVSSGDPVLDAAACKTITRRARYTPAIGHNGQPVISHEAQGVNWRLPE